MGTVINNMVHVIEFYQKHRKKFRIVYQPDRHNFSMDQDGLLEEFKIACHMVNNVKDMCFVVDEIDRYVKPSHMPAYFANLVDYGRHYGIDIIVNCRRSARIPRDLTAQADTLISFNQKEPRDLDYLIRVIGEDAKQLPSLPPYHFIKFRDGESTRHEPI